MDIGLKSLKFCEGAQGHSIVESSVDFDIDRPLTEDEKTQTTEYCMNDVAETINIFFKGKSEYVARMGLIEEFHRPLSDLGLTKTQQSAKILSQSTTQHRRIQPHIEPQPQPEPLPVPYGVKTDFTVTLPPTCIVRKYTNVRDWFLNPKNWHYKDGQKQAIISGDTIDDMPKGKTNNLTVNFGNVPMSFGWGGGHGALKRYHSKGYYLNVDVASLYPSLMLAYPEYCWSTDVYGEGSLDLYDEILKKRLSLKAKGLKKQQAPLKIVLNATYGDLRKKAEQIGLNICIFGQFLVCIDLFEILENYGDIMQANTDGILIRKRDDYPTSPEEWYSAVDDACYEWERRTGLRLEFDWYGYGELWQKDVSNYCIMGEDGHVKTKGSWLREPTEFDRNLEIVRKSVLRFFTDGIKPEETILSCTDLRDFQYVAKISGKYTAIAHGNPSIQTQTSQILHERCIRIFASKNASDLTYYKCKRETGKWARLENSPAHARAINGNIVGTPLPDWLDRQWYVDLAHKRIQAFGVDI
jgi:DNA polymerase